MINRHFATVFLETLKAEIRRLIITSDHSSFEAENANVESKTERNLDDEPNEMKRSQTNNSFCWLLLDCQINE